MVPALSSAERWLRVRAVAWRPLVYSTLATVLDPDAFPAHFDVITRTLVRLIFVEADKTGARARFVLLEPSDTEAAACLADAGIPHLAGWVDDATFWPVLDAARKVPPRAALRATRPVGNYSEAWLRRQSRETFDELLSPFQANLAERSSQGRAMLMEMKAEVAANYSLHQETALAALFSDTASAARWARFRCDLLVCRSGGPPLLALEFDGPHHDDPRRRAREAQRDRALADSGLSVLRVSYRNMPDRSMDELAARRTGQATVRVLRWLLNALLEVFEIARRSDDRCAAALQHVSGDSNECDAIEDAHIDDMLDRLDTQQEAGRLVDPLASPLLNDRKVIPDSLRVEAVANGGRRGRVRPIGAAQDLVTPEYYFQLSLSSDLRAMSPHLARVLDDVVRMEALWRAANA